MRWTSNSLAIRQPDWNHPFAMIFHSHVTCSSVSLSHLYDFSRSTDWYAHTSVSDFPLQPRLQTLGALTTKVARTELGAADLRH
jgi:hypothetical protein